MTNSETLGIVAVTGMVVSLLGVLFFAYLRWKADQNKALSTLELRKHGVIS